MTALTTELAGCVGADHVLTDPGITEGYERDWMGRHAGRHSVVVRPGTVDEVAGVLAVCRSHGVPVVPQGGNTGLVGGGVPHEGEVVLSTRRLLDGFELDVDGGQVSLPAGMTISAAQQLLGRDGLELGIDLASRDSATVGGVVATNAGGLRVPRFGHVRQQLVGIEAVLPDGGRVEQMSGLLKDNTGYHFPGLLCGSEGTLAVVTRARLRVWPRATQRVTAVLGLESMSQAVEAVRVLRDAVPGFESGELVFASGVEQAVALGAARVFGEQPAVELLVEFAERSRSEARLVEHVLQALADVDPVDARVAADVSDQQRLWQRRERHPELVTRLGGVPLKLDTAVPVGSLPAYEKDVRAAVADADPQARLVLYGHVADGNLHVNVACSQERSGDVRDAVFRVVCAHQGSLSAEHGIGRDKRDRLDWVRTPAEVAAMRALKSALDPQALLNPNAVLPPS